MGIFRFGLAGAIFAFAIGSAAAQPTPSLPPIPEAATAEPATTTEVAGEIVQRICNRVPTVGPITELDLQFFRRCQETLKIHQENLKLEQETEKTKQEATALKSQNELGWIAALITFGPLVGTFLGALPIVWGFWEKGKTDRRLVRLQRAKERAERRETHTFHLLEHLVSTTSSHRAYAASGLIAMIREDLHPPAEMSPSTSKRIQKQHAEETSELTQRRDAIAMMGTLFGQLRGSGLEGPVAKFIADELAKILVAQKEAGSPIPLGDFNLQQIQARNAYWKAVDATKADFFESDFEDASFRNAILHEAQFYKTKLARAVFTGAHAQGANFTGAELEGANFRGAHLEGAEMANALNLDTALFDEKTTWDTATTWPRGFDPVAKGLAPQATTAEPAKTSLFGRRSSRGAA